MIYVEEIEELVNAVCESGGITPLTLFAKATGNAHAYSAIRYKSGRITIRTVDLLVRYCADHYPDISWPEPAKRLAALRGETTKPAARFMSDESARRIKLGIPLDVDR